MKTKNLLLVVAAMLTLNATAAKLNIPTIPHITVKVERGSTTLGQGVTLNTGDQLKVTYTADEGYRIKENQQRSIVKTVTVSSDNLYEDLTTQISGASQGFTSVTSSKPYETYVTSGWVINMPNRNAGLGSKSLTYTYTGTGTTKLTFARGLNSYFFQYGSFRFYFYINGSEIYSPHSYYGANPYSGELGTPLVYDTITFNATGNDKLEWKCEKTDNGGWADNEGRKFYIGHIKRQSSTKGDYTVKTIETEEGTPIDPASILTLSIPQIPNVSIVVKRGNETLADGAKVIIGDQLTITYTAQNGYAIKENGQTTLTKTVTVSKTDSKADITYDIDGESQYYTMIDGTKKYFTKVTPENPFGNSDPNDTIPFWPMERGWLVNMPPHTYNNSATATAVLSYTYTGTGETTISSIMNISTCCGTTYNGYGAFKLYVRLDGNVVNSTIHDYTVTPASFELLMFDTISFTATGNNKIEWVCEKTHRGSWADSDGRPFFVGYIHAIGAGGGYTIPSVELSNRAVTVEFQAEEHCSLSFASLDGVSFEGGTAYIGQELNYGFAITDRGYAFVDGSQSYNITITLTEDMVSADNKIVIKSKPVATQQGYTLKITEQPHAALRYFKLNGTDTTTNVAVYRNDYLQLEYATEEGFSFCASKDTVYKIEANVYNFFITDNSISINVPDVCIAPPLIDLNMVDDSTALISWTGNFDSYKLFVMEQPVEGDIDYHKGSVLLTEKEYQATDLTPGKKYYVYLQGLGDVNSEWVTLTFVAGADKCVLNIYMQDAYGDGWTGCGLNFIEGVDTTFITLNGEIDTMKYYSFGDTLRVEWVTGGYPSEVAFEITDWTGTVLASAAYDQAGYYPQGERFVEKVICEPDPDVCKAKISNFKFTVNDGGATYSLSWSGHDAASYLVAVTQNPAPTTAYLDSIAQQTTDTHFDFACRKFHLYDAYVKPVCSNGETKQWSGYVLYADTALTSHADTVENAIPIALDSQHSGHFFEDVIWSNDTLQILYTFTLTDSADLAIGIDVNKDTEYYVSTIMKLMNEKGEVLQRDYYPWMQTSLAAGKYYVSFIYSPYYLRTITDYTVTLKQHIEPVELKPIELDFTETSDFTDAVPLYLYYRMPLTKGYKFTVTDTANVYLSVYNEFSTDVYLVLLKENDNIPGTYEALHSYYSFICSRIDPGTYAVYVCGGYENKLQPEDQYTVEFKKTDKNSMPATEITQIQLDTIIHSTVKGTDKIYSVKTRHMGYFGHLYELVIEQDTYLSMSIEKESAEDFIYAYILNDETRVISSISDDSEIWTHLQLKGAEGGKHYYIMAYSETYNIDYTLRLIKSVDYDNPPIKHTIDVGKRYESDMTIDDIYSEAHSGPYEAFKVALQKDKKYALWLHGLDVGTTTTMQQWGLALMHPGVKKGDYWGNSATYKTGYQNWLGLKYTADTTAEYTLFIDAYNNNKYLYAPYEFMVAEIKPFADLMNQDAKAVQLPHSESGHTSGSAKYEWSGEFGFHTPVSQITSDAGAYDAVAFSVKVPAGDTLFVEAGGSADATIHIFDITDQTTIHNYTRVDDTRHSFPYEHAYRVNTADAERTFIVVLSFSGIMMEDISWSIQTGIGQQAVKHQTASAVADMNTVEIVEGSTEDEAKNVLGALKLSAVDKDNKKICDITNDIRWWRVDFSNNRALYEVNNSDLPFGYEFANGTEWIEVRFDFVAALEQVSNPTFRPYKVMRNGVIYIVTQHGIYNIFGIRLE